MFGKAIKKYGWNNFEHNVLFSNISFDEACEIEKQLIAKYHTNNPKYGYNIASGGMENPMLIDSAKQKISGENHYCIKSVICINTKEVFPTIREAEEKYKQHGVTNQNLSKCCKGLRNYCGHFDDGTPIEWAYYDKNVDYEFKIIEEVPHNIKPVIQYTLDGKYITTYESAREAERQTGIGYKMISRVCKGERPKTHGYIFHFVNEQNKRGKVIKYKQKKLN